MRYGSIEWAYAQPIAQALAEDSSFRAWFLGQTPFAAMAGDARLLDKEMKARRSAVSETWWRSHYTEKCRCAGCSGQETDMLAIFEAKGARFALHIEVKQPKDNFNPAKDQALNYGLRAKCWAQSAPAAVLPHSGAATVLLHCNTRRDDYGQNIDKFDTAIAFQDVWRACHRTVPTEIP